MEEQQVQAASPAQALQAQGGGKKLDPVMQKKIDTYTALLMKIMHGKKSRNKVMDMLKNGEPSQSIPATALTVNDIAERTAKVKDYNVILGASPYLISDLVEIGTSAGLFQLVPEQIQQIYQDTLQKYIEAGIKEGKIDPVQLQADVEPMLNDQQRQQGMQIGQEAGLPTQANEQMAVRHINQKTPQKPQSLLGGKQNG